MLFDCDGTLVDTVAAHTRAWTAALAAHGRTRDAAWFRERAGLSSGDVLAQLVHAEPGLDPGAVDTVRRAELEVALPRVREVAAVAALARRLAAAGVPVAVASGGSRSNVQASLAATGLSVLFPVVVTREDATLGKPAPDLFLAAARRLGVAPDHCLVYEDSDEGLAGAAAAGMGAVDVRPWV